MTQIKVDPSVLKQTKWNGYAARFLFGVLITAVAGIIAKEFGPGFGGLFLAFPAIFPASATLIEKHEKEKKELRGLNGAARGRSAASIDAAGASMGSIGLVVFAFVVWSPCLGRPRDCDAFVSGRFSGGLANSKVAVSQGKRRPPILFFLIMFRRLVGSDQTQ